MKVEKLSTLLTFAANIGVVFGLIILAYEIKQNTDQLRAQASYSINQGLDMLNSGIYNNYQFAEIVRKGEEDLSSLNPTELTQFSTFQFSRINLAIHVNKLEEEGIKAVHFNYVKYLIKEFQTKPGLRQFADSIEGAVWEGSEELYEKLTQ